MGFNSGFKGLSRNLSFSYKYLAVLKMLSVIKYRFELARYSQYTRHLIKYGGNAIPKYVCPESMIANLPLDIPCFNS